MDEITYLYNARNTAIEMLKDRGYTVPIEIECNRITDFRPMYSKKQYDIEVDNPTKCYVKFILHTKVRPNNIRDLVSQIRDTSDTTENKDINDNIIIVIKNKPNSTLKKLTKEFKGIQIFWIKLLVINITKHKLNPTFIKITEPEIEDLLTKLKLQSRQQLPLMLKDDPISLYFNFSSGNVCKVVSKSITNGEYVSYRCIK
jgi:DNA-directed RNA polymerase I, II, and III subunit RPABC1